ncbi:uncharacterized protein LOC129577472 [Sitodiplosis mosellana]|uniref:uncharacterized protein LOC129577472 n=1 Tax=Sitodiplosis mosellana TaxID=263140 RepID=UPI00244409F7|nr:uncharacterized protein LOC129577472 [Sitodiplosis mosellana]
MFEFRKNIKLKSFPIISLLVVISYTVIILADRNGDVIFQFPEYDYKETSKNELSYREFESACDQSKRCEPLARMARLRCVRECISPSCYQEIYEFDELEEGEIDVRLNSFKGCFIQRLGRSRNR